MLLKINIILFFIFTAFVCTGNQQNADLKDKKHSEVNIKKSEQKQDDITIKTADSKDISASYFYDAGEINVTQPLVILIHQFNQSKAQWKQDFIDSLVETGFKVLTYDIRGHGQSSKLNYDLSKLLDDPDEAPNDIKAVFQWAKNEKGIDTSRIGVMGTSIGGNLACYAALNLNSKVTISVSNGKITFEIFTGYDERMMGRPYFPKFKNALFICGSKDADHQQGQKWILDNFVESPKDLKVYDSDKHGKALIEQFPEINTLSINWFKKYL